MKVEKVDDGAEPQAVDDIADGTADDQADGGGQQRARSAPQPDEQYCDDYGRKEREGDAVDRGIVVEQPEADPAIAHEHDVEEVGDAQKRAGRGQMAHEPQVRKLIKDDDD